MNNIPQPNKSVQVRAGGLADCGIDPLAVAYNIHQHTGHNAPASDQMKALSYIWSELAARLSGYPHQPKGSTCERIDTWLERSA